MGQHDVLWKGEVNPFPWDKSLGRGGAGELLALTPKGKLPLVVFKKRNRDKSIFQIESCVLGTRVYVNLLKQ